VTDYSRVVGKSASVLGETAKSLSTVASLVKRFTDDELLQAIGYGGEFHFSRFVVKQSPYFDILQSRRW
jgi:hypothetical protein